MPVRLKPTLAVALIATLALAGCTAADTTETATDSAVVESDTTTTTTDFAASNGDCEAMAATFRDVESANPDSPDPELTATCDGDVLSVTSNAIPDYLYIATTPEELQASTVALKLAVSPTVADVPGEVPALGTIGIAVNGVPIYGPTENTGGDVLSLRGALSECGSHSSPVEFHLHLFGWDDDVDCLYSAEEVESGDSILVGWSADGYPIMSGYVCADEECTEMVQLESSWQLTDDLLFASDTWSAHTYVEGSGDLDQCNGRVDADGQYRYYTTTTFPYFMGCYYGEVSDDAIAGGGGAGPGGRP